MSSYKIFADGASKGNPGPSGIGVVIKNGKDVKVKEISYYIGQVTNNVAEYLALIVALIEAENIGLRQLNIFLDSELLTKQVNGDYMVKSAHLKPLLALVKYLSTKFDKVSCNHITRDKNKEADKLANKAIKAHLF